jgi:hypothetical protein
LSDSKTRRIYDQYGAEGVNQADQMGEGGGGPSPHSHGGGGPGFHFGGGGPGGGHHMSQEDADHIFSQFFGHGDPFGGMGMGGGPRRQQQQQQDPFMMFGGGGGMPGMGGGMGGGPGGRQSSIRRPPEKRYDAIPKGTIVSFKDLVGRPEMNGDRGEVQSYDPQSGRYTVIVEDTDEPLRVKPSNLLQHVHGRVQGLESQPSLNGLRGTIMAWNEHKQRYNVYIMDLSKVISLRPANIVLDTGTVCKIAGLMAKPELNGKYGTIKSWIAEANRYDIQLTATQIIRVKVENIRV